MSRFIGVLLLVLVCSSFKIEKLFSSFTQLIKAETEVGDVNWPFTVISKGTWTMNSLTLKSTPARNSNNAITMVSILLFRKELPMIILNSKKLISMSNWMDYSFIPNQWIGKLILIKLMPLNSITITSFLHLLHPELMWLLSPTKTLMVNKMEFGQWPLNFDLIMIYLR